MAAFKDSAGQLWELKITLPMVARLREAGYDLNTIRSNAESLDVLNDPETTGQILWVLCEAQADRRHLTPEQFAALFDGPTIWAAVEALIGATADFTQRPAVAAAINKALPGAMSRQDEAAVKLLTKALETAGLNPLGGNSPEAAASTPSG